MAVSMPFCRFILLIELQSIIAVNYIYFFAFVTVLLLLLTYFAAITMVNKDSQNKYNWSKCRRSGTWPSSQRSPVSQFITGHFVPRDSGTCCNAMKERRTVSSVEPLIAPCINVTVCAVSHLSVKTVAQILAGSLVVEAAEAASWSGHVGELTRRNDQAKC